MNSIHNRKKSMNFKERGFTVGDLLIMSIIVFAAHRLSYHHEKMEKSKLEKEQMPKKIEDIHKQLYELKVLLENKY